MSVFKSLRDSLVPIHRQGYPFLVSAALIAGLLFRLPEPSGFVGVILIAWCAYFFRDPARVTPLREDLVISPADGRVCFVGLSSPPPEPRTGFCPQRENCDFYECV